MQKKSTVMDQLELAGGIVSSLLISVLGMTAASAVCVLVNGASIVVGVLPTWALAGWVGSLAVVLFSTWRIGVGSLGVRAVGISLFVMFSLGAEGVIHDATHNSASGTQSPNFLSFETVVALFSWFWFGASLVAAIVASVGYVDWVSSRRAAAKDGRL